MVWNDALAICKQSEKLPSNNDLQKLVITQANVELQITNLIKLRISICYVRHWIDYKFTYNNSTVELTYINNDWNINVRV